MVAEWYANQNLIAKFLTTESNQELEAWSKSLTLELTMGSAEKLKLHCNSCLGLRKHSILFTKKQEYFEEYEEGHEYSEITVYLARHRFGRLI